MANKLYEEESVKAIADAIREKNGLTRSYTIGEMGGQLRPSPLRELIYL